MERGLKRRNNLIHRNMGRQSEEGVSSNPDQNIEVQPVVPFNLEQFRSQSWLEKDIPIKCGNGIEDMIRSKLMVLSAKDVCSVDGAIKRSDSASSSASSTFGDQLSMNSVEVVITQELRQQKHALFCEDLLLSSQSGSSEMEDAVLHGYKETQSDKTAASPVYNGGDDDDDETIRNHNKDPYLRKRSRRYDKPSIHDDVDDQLNITSCERSANELPAGGAYFHDHHDQVYKRPRSHYYSEQKAPAGVSFLSETPIGWPSRAEIEDFLADVEQLEHTSQMIRYNFDFEKEAPMEGRFEWISIAQA